MSDFLEYTIYFVNLAYKTEYKLSMPYRRYCKHNKRDIDTVRAVLK